MDQVLSKQKRLQVASEGGTVEIRVSDYLILRLLFLLLATADICSWCSNNLVKVKWALLQVDRRRRAHLPYIGLEPEGGSTTIVRDARQCDARPMVTFPACADTKLITAWWETQMCVNSLPKDAPKSAAARSRTRDLLIASPAP